MKQLINTLMRITITVCCLSISTYVYSEGIIIEYASGEFRDDTYLIDTIIDYDLSDPVIEALQHGIQLRFVVNVRIQRQRRFVWDKTIATANLSYQLAYLPLTNNYVLTNLNDGERRYLQDLDETLDYLGTLRDFAVVNVNQLASNESYKCQVSSHLRIRNLPLPLQPLAMISPSWELDSDWYEWIIE
jgi:hypothetical protein